MSHSRVYPDSRVKRVVFVCVGESLRGGLLRLEHEERLQLLCDEYDLRLQGGFISSRLEALIVLAGGVSHEQSPSTVHAAIAHLTGYAERLHIDLPIVHFRPSAPTIEACVHGVEELLQEQKIKPTKLVLVVPASYAARVESYVAKTWPQLPLVVLCSRDRRSWWRKMSDVRVVAGKLIGMSKK